MGSVEDPIIFEDNENGVVVQVEKEGTWVPSPYSRTLVEIIKPNQSIDAIEERFFTCWHHLEKGWGGGCSNC